MSEPVEAEVLKEAFIASVESVESHLGSPNWDLANLKASVCLELLKHPSAIDLMDDLTFRRSLKRFRELNCGRAGLDEREVIEQLTQCALVQAQARLDPASVRDEVATLQPEMGPMGPTNNAA